MIEGKEQKVSAANRKLRMGMVGGGQGAFIGAVHRSGAAIDGQIELVCGAFASDPDRSIESGKSLFLPPDRVYRDYKEMFEKESQLPEGERMDFVSIVTPNNAHFEPAKLALKHGFHIMMEKPLCLNLEEAYELEKLVKNSDVVFALCHTYSAYPMVKQARDMVRNGELGEIRKVIVEYPQGWLADLLESTGQKQADWRTDPTRNGAGGGTGDIGTHAAHLAEHITGLKVTELCADITIFVPGRKLDDDANVLLRFENGAKGILHCSQICTGDENNLNIRVYGDKGGLEWHQLEPNTLYVKHNEKPWQLYRTGGANLTDTPNALTRTPAGHPEGYIEAFANIYRNMAAHIRAKMTGQEPDAMALDYPSIDEGVRGMEFVMSVIESSKSDKKWFKFADWKNS